MLYNSTDSLIHELLYFNMGMFFRQGVGTTSSTVRLRYVLEHTCQVWHNGLTPWFEPITDA